MPEPNGTSDMPRAAAPDGGQYQAGIAMRARLASAGRGAACRAPPPLHIMSAIRTRKDTAEMPAATPSIPLGLLAPGEFFMNPSGAAVVQTGQNTSFNAAVSGSVAGPSSGAVSGLIAGGASGAVVGVFSGAYSAAGFASVASGLTAVTGTIGAVTNIAARTNHFSTCPSGGGAQLPLPSAVPYPIAVANFGVSGLSVFPPTVSGIIGNATSGVAYLQPTGTTTVYSFFGGNQYSHT